MRFIYILSAFLLSLPTIGFSQQIFKVSAPIDAELHTAAVADLKAAYRLLNITINITPLPAKRALLEAEQGTLFDAELARIKEAESLLSNFIRIPVVLRTISSVAVTSEETTPLKAEDFSQYRTASIRGILATNRLLSGVDNILVDSTTQGINMLLYRRIDAFIVLDFMIKGLEKKLYEQGLVIQSSKLSTANFYHYIHKKHEAIVPALSQALSQTTGNPIEAPSNFN